MAKRHTPTDNSSNTDITWDGSPLHRYAWYEAIEGMLAITDPSFRTLWEQGYVLSRGKVITVTTDQSTQLYHDNATICSFRDPCPFGAVTPKHAGELPAIPAEQASRYVVAPESVKAIDRALADRILDTISTPQRRDDYRRLTAGSGVALLAKLSIEARTIAPKLGTWAATELASHVAQGLSSATVIGLDAFRSRYAELNNQLPVGRRGTDVVLQEVYCAAVRELGPMINTRLDLKLAITPNALESLDNTVRVLTLILEEEEFTSGTGQALAATRERRDPRKAPKTNTNEPSKESKRPTTVWTKGDEICTICKDKPTNGGQHWRFQCPSRQSRDQSTPPKPATGVARSLEVPNDVDSTTYNSSDETLIDMTDTSLAKLFENDLDEDSVEDETEEDQSSVGVVRALKMPPTQSLTTQSQVTPTRPPDQSARELVASLTPDSPMPHVRSVESAASTGVSMATGGSARRLKTDVIGDMRHAVGLPPLPIPMGLLVQAAVGEPFNQSVLKPTPQPVPPVLSVASQHLPSSWPPASAPAPEPQAPQAAPMTTHRANRAPISPLPTFDRGFEAITYFIQAGEDGEMLHVHHFPNPHGGECCVYQHGPHDEPDVLDVPPAGSQWLGVVDKINYWGTPDGSVVRVPVGARRKPSPPASLAPLGSSPNPLNLLLIIIAALLSAVITLLLNNNNNSRISVSSLDAPNLHDPGAQLLPITTFAAYLGCLLSTLVFCQAKLAPRSWWQTSAPHRGHLERSSSHQQAAPRHRTLGYAKALTGNAAAAAKSRKQSRPAHAWPSTCTTWIEAIVDSGCTWHVHNNLDDISARTPCTDTVVDASGTRIQCTWKGSLSLTALGTDGREYSVTLQGVRYAPSFEDTLISVDQMWFTSKVDTVFRDACQLVFTRNVFPDGSALRIPFHRIDGSFRWTFGLTRKTPSASARTPGSARSLKSGIHTATSQSHVEAMPSNDLAALLHRRLHVSLNLLRRLGTHSADAPPHVSKATTLTCPVCAEANATAASHPTSLYRPSHAGRLIHLDIVGPFVRSYAGSYQYALILIDDHTRQKFVFFLKQKSDAPAIVRRFIAQFNALLSTHSAAPVKIVGSLHTDNAGELTSREFTELLDSSSVAHTTCPPHTHQLNGVAERAIRSAVALTRSYLAGAHLSAAFWPYALAMAVDVLNRTTGPTAVVADGPSSHELLLGARPRVLNIMPFGCRAFAVKPASHLSKTTLEPRAWVGVNLGRSMRTPGAYQIYVPHLGRVVLTSNVYFQEALFPLRPKGLRHDDTAPSPPQRADGAHTEPASPVDVPAAPPVALPAAAVPQPNAAAAATLLSSASTLSNCAHVFHERAGRALPASSRVLLLFSGMYSRPDGLAAFLERGGLTADSYDYDDEHGGGAMHDILNDAFFTGLLTTVAAGSYFAVIAAPPCSTYSISRFFPIPGKPGPPVIRTRPHILGLPDCPADHARELRRANEVTRRTAVLLRAAVAAGAECILENPADRGDPTHHLLFHFPEHGPIWLDPHMLDLYKAASLESVTFAQCMFGAETQKYTTLWFTAKLTAFLRPLSRQICSHAPGTHAAPAGGQQLPDGTWNSASSAAYPADLNLFFADILLKLATQQVHAPFAPGATLPPSQPKPHRNIPLPPPAEVNVAEPHHEPAPPSPAHEPGAEPMGEGNDAADTPARLPSGDERDADSPATASHKQPAFRRGLGAIHTRSRGIVSVVKRTGSDPANHREAMRQNRVGWSTAEQAEIDNHEREASWRYCLRSEMPPQRRIVKLTWVYKVKRDGRLKARLCVQGCTQRPGVDYDQTFCAAMRAGSLRLLCALAARLNLQLRRWDFVAAYLQGELLDGEVVYCSPPPGYDTVLINGKPRLVQLELADDVDRICLVEKPVYGMSQAGRRWQRTLFPWMLDWRGPNGERLTQSELDPCIFSCRASISTPSGDRDETLFIGCYVDDLFILASHYDEHSLYAHFTRDLQDSWEVEDEGEAADLLNVEISREENHIKLTQTSYINKLMATFAPDGRSVSSHGATYPLKSQPPARVPAGTDLPQLVLNAVSGQEAKDVEQNLLKDYQSLVGSLLYCAVNTRPDVSFAVSMLCRAMGKPTSELYVAALRVLYYLHHHKHVGLRYGACDLDLSGMSDSDWAVQHSTSGYVFTYNQAAISWSSKRQTSVALSSCEAEIMALSEAAKEGVYLSRFLLELGFPSADIPTLATDNTGARDLAYNPEHHERVKHIERRHFYIRELVEDHQLVVPYVATVDNMADFFTKPLAAAAFYSMRNRIMNVPPR